MIFSEMTLFVCMSSHVAMLVLRYYFHMAMQLTSGRCVAFIMDLVFVSDAMFLVMIILVYVALLIFYQENQKISFLLTVTSKR